MKNFNIDWNWLSAVSDEATMNLPPGISIDPNMTTSSGDLDFDEEMSDGLWWGDGYDSITPSFDLDWSLIEKEMKEMVKDNSPKCECGAEKVYGTDCDVIYHSDWCVKSKG